MTKTSYVILLIAIALALFIIFDKFVCNKPPPNIMADKHTEDSLRSVIKDMEFKNNDVIDSFKTSNTVLVAKIGAQEIERERLKANLKSSAAKIEKYQSLVKVTVISDTLSNWDSLNSEFSNYIALSEAETKKADSIIINKDSIIENIDSVNAVLVRFNHDLKTSFETVNKNYDALYKDYSKAIKKRKFHKFLDKSMVVIIAGLTIGLIVK